MPGSSPLGAAYRDEVALAPEPLAPAPAPLPDTEEPAEAHIVRKDGVTAAYIEGTPLQAMCGVVFVPSRDPSGMPVCERCQRRVAQYRGRGAN